MARLTVYGARGSFPVFGDAYRRYGGQTSCFTVENDQGIVVIDAGTGIRDFGLQLNERKVLPPITILFTHFHLDHVIGLPAFRPLLRKDASITFMGHPTITGDWQRALQTLMGKPFWPVGLQDVEAHVQFRNLPDDGALQLNGSTLTWCPIWHPQMCLSYKIATPNATIVLATDREHGEARFDESFMAFARRADILIHDAQYTPEEHPSRYSGWGHSTWEQSAQIAHQLSAKRLILTSHDPSRTDEALDQIVAQAARIFPNTQAATERMVLAEDGSA